MRHFQLALTAKPGHCRFRVSTICAGSPLIEFNRIFFFFHGVTALLKRSLKRFLYFR